MRIYLDRPWYATGDGELLGVLLAASDDADVVKSTSQWAADPVWAQQGPAARAALPLSDVLHSTGLDDRRVPGRPVGPPAALPAGRSRRLAARVGARLRAGVLAGARALVRRRGLRPAHRVLAVRPARGRPLPARLEPRACTSRPVTVCDFAQLTPERTATLTRPDDRHVRVVVTGPVGVPKTFLPSLIFSPPFVAHVQASRTVRARLERRVPAVGTDLGWQAVAQVDLPILGIDGTVVSWAGQIELPQALPPRRPGENTGLAGGRRGVGAASPPTRPRPASSGSRAASATRTTCRYKIPFNTAPVVCCASHADGGEEWLRDLTSSATWSSFCRASWAALLARDSPARLGTLRGRRRLEPSRLSAARSRQLALPAGDRRRAPRTTGSSQWRSCRICTSCPACGAGTSATASFSTGCVRGFTSSRRRPERSGAELSSLLPVRLRLASLEPLQRSPPEVDRRADPRALAVAGRALRRRQADLHLPLDGRSGCPLVHRDGKSGPRSTRKLITLGTPYRGALNALDQLVEWRAARGSGRCSARTSRPSAAVCRRCTSSCREYACVEVSGGAAQDNGGRAPRARHRHGRRRHAFPRRARPGGGRATAGRVRPAP